MGILRFGLCACLIFATASAAPNTIHAATAKPRAATATRMAPAPSAPSPLLAEAIQSIQKGNANYSKACETGDAKLMAMQFAPNGSSTGSGGRVYRGRPLIEKHFEYIFAGGHATHFNIVTEDVWVIGETAYETGRYLVGNTGQPDSGGHYVTVWQRQPDGSGWKIVADIGVQNN